MPTADLPHSDGQLNNYNVAQLQFALSSNNEKGSDDNISFLHDISPSGSPAIIPVESDHLDYDSRRMSSSATSNADTDSSILSRGEKRSLTPGDSPLPKKQRNSDDQSNWDIDSSSASLLRAPRTRFRTMLASITPGSNSLPFSRLLKIAIDMKDVAPLSQCSIPRVASGTHLILQRIYDKITRPATSHLIPSPLMATILPATEFLAVPGSLPILISATATTAIPV
ncbi:hypothetical protein BDZ97DRAFT_566159 [Flammula alnicola]|nr:hypothetical protein BDZ97DRAFT_566159 [Flammula alnicola]